MQGLADYAPGLPALPALQLGAPEALGEGLYRVPVGGLEDFTDQVEALLDWARRPRVRVPPPNSMHVAGFALEQTEVLTSLNGLRALYPERDWPELTQVYAFIAAYGPREDRHLGFHVDDAELTLAICLGGDFEGSELRFQSLRCGRHLQDEVRPEECIDVLPEPGIGLLHQGAHRHEVLPLSAGRRRSLILWARGDALVEHAGAGPCPGWCGSQS